MLSRLSSPRLFLGSNVDNNINFKICCKKKDIFLPQCFKAAISKNQSTGHRNTRTTQMGAIVERSGTSAYLLTCPICDSSPEEHS